MELKRLEGHSSNVASIASILNTDLIISCSWDKTIKIWNYRTGNLEKTIFGHESYVLSIASILNTNYIASGSLDGEMKI